MSPEIKGGSRTVGGRDAAAGIPAGCPVPPQQADPRFGEGHRQDRGASILRSGRNGRPRRCRHGPAAPTRARTLRPPRRRRAADGALPDVVPAEHDGCPGGAVREQGPGGRAPGRAHAAARAGDERGGQAGRAGGGRAGAVGGWRCAARRRPGHVPRVLLHGRGRSLPRFPGPVRAPADSRGHEGVHACHGIAGGGPFEMHSEMAEFQKGQSIARAAVSSAIEALPGDVALKRGACAVQRGKCDALQPLHSLHRLPLRNPLHATAGRPRPLPVAGPAEPSPAADGVRAASAQSRAAARPRRRRRARHPDGAQADAKRAARRAVLRVPGQTRPVWVAVQAPVLATQRRRPPAADAGSSGAAQQTCTACSGGKGACRRRGLRGKGGRLHGVSAPRTPPVLCD